MTPKPNAYYCWRCGSMLRTDKHWNHFCEHCQVYRPPFYRKGSSITSFTDSTTTAPPLTTPADENLSTRGGQE